MINISIDDKACVSCSLCVDTCPTKVFSFDNAKDLPQVTEAKECFGCLSCTEICPADAIRHEGAVKSDCFYHDDYALHLAQRLAVADPVRFQVIDSPKGMNDAMRDLSVRLLSVGAVLKDVIGAGLPSVGLMAGRSLATQLPRYQPPKNLAEALELAKKEFAPAWELDFQAADDNTLKIEVKGCIVRDICSQQNIPLGGELCVLFYNYLSGYLGKMAKTQLKIADTERSAEKCCYNVKILR